MSAPVAQTILLTGAAGRLGRTLAPLLTAAGHTVIGMDSAQPGSAADSAIRPLDVTDFYAVRTAVEAVAPSLIVHAAAWTDVDGCARDPERAVLVNGIGAQHMAAAAYAVGAGIVYISSNEVFDGETTQPYREYDPTRPINPYGYSKWVGEQAVRSLNPRHYIVRTAWLFAHGGGNFVQAILKAARMGSPLRVVANEVANPTYTDDLAAALTALVTSERYGPYHFVNAGAVSRYEFARRILDRAGFPTTPITRIHSREWPRPSTPPAYSPLHNQAGAAIGITLRPWQDALDVFLQREGLFAPVEA